jgi:pimeloyl-ACP methyl ester carboxylesterase
MVASTSFRRNGLVVRDAIEDLDALRDVLIEAHGRPSQALLVGEGLGGTIVTIMAERLRERYTGALALVPAFDMSEPNSMTGITHSPHIPLLLVATRTSYQPILQYTQRVPVALDDQLVRPQIARVDRTGRTNLNDAERLVALRLLHAWMDQGREAYASPENRQLAGYSTPWRAIEKSPDLDITCTPRPGPSTVVWADDRRSFTARVLEVAPYSGHVTLDIRPEDFNQLGLGRKSYVEMRAGERTIRVAMGRDFDSVKRGDWVAFPDANGTICLARHGGNAAVSASLRAGDLVTFRRYDLPPTPGRRPWGRAPRPALSHSEFGVFIGAAARLLDRVLLRVGGHLALDRSRRIDACQVGKLQCVDDHISELLLDFGALGGILHSRARRLGGCPKEVLHQLSRLGGQRHAQILRGVKLLPLAFVGEGEDAFF